MDSTPKYTELQFLVDFMSKFGFVEHSLYQDKQTMKALMKSIYA